MNPTPNRFGWSSSDHSKLFWLAEFDSVEMIGKEAPLLWRRLLEQTDLCFEHAAEAARGKRFSAACGLLVTAQELLRRAQSVECSARGHLVLERAVIIRLDWARRELEEWLELAVEVRLYAL